MSKNGKKIKIGYIINFLENGGPTRVLQNIIRELDLDKYNITIITLTVGNNKNIINEFRKKGIVVYEYNINKEMSSLLKNKKMIIRDIINMNFDIIHVHGIVGASIISSRKIMTKKIATIHNNMFEDYKYTYGSVKGMIYAIYHLHCLRKFDKVISCSRTSYLCIKRFLSNSSFIRNGIYINKEKIHCKNKEQKRKELQIGSKDYIYIYMGVLNKRKNVVELVKLFNGNLKENEYLVIIGDGGQKKEIIKTIKSKNIKLIGFKTDVLDYLDAADIYVSNSTSEGFSISVIEALAMGKKCFLSDINSHKECFDIDKKYYIGESFNNKTFLQKKECLIKNTNKDCASIIEFQEKYLSSKAMGDEYKKVYCELVK